MRVLIAEQDHANYARLLGEAAPELDIVTSGDSAELARLAPDCPVWLGQPDLLASLLRQGHGPRWMQSTWAGITPLLAKGLPRDYRLTRAVGIFGQVMAEYMLTYMLIHERDVLARLVSQVERRWDERPGRTLEGRRVLVVGTGDIGQRVAEFLAPFGVTLYGIASSAREQAPFVEVVGLEDLPRMVGQADYVLNLLPDTPATHDLYDATLFKCFKPSALFINAGRGGGRCRPGRGIEGGPPGRRGDRRLPTGAAASAASVLDGLGPAVDRAQLGAHLASGDGAVVRRECAGVPGGAGTARGSGLRARVLNRPRNIIVPVGAALRRERAATQPPAVLAAQLPPGAALRPFRDARPLHKGQ